MGGYWRGWWGWYGWAGIDGVDIDVSMLVVSILVASSHDVLFAFFVVSI